MYVNMDGKLRTIQSRMHTMRRKKHERKSKISDEVLQENNKKNMCAIKRGN